MKRFTKFFEQRPQNFRGHDYKVDSKSMTIPDVVPTLKDIILSGTATQVGTPIYDESFEAGVRRFGIQSAPLEMVLNGREPLEGEDEARSNEDEAPSGSQDVKHPAASESERPSGEEGGQNQ